MNENMLSIKEVCNEYNLSPVYVRRMISKGKISVTRIEIAKNTEKIMIEREEIERWRASLNGGNRREDGRSKFTLYATVDEVEKLKALLGESEIEIVRANKVKQIKEI